MEITVNIDGIGLVDFEVLYGQSIDTGPFSDSRMASHGIIAKVIGSERKWNIAVQGNWFGIGQTEETLLKSISIAQFGDELTYDENVSMAPGFTILKCSIAEALSGVNLDNNIRGTFAGIESMILMGVVLNEIE